MMMEVNEVSSREKLDQMFREGKLTREDYDLLLRSIERGQEKPSLNRGPAFPDIARRLPWQVWTSIGILVLAALYQVPYFMHRHPMRSLAILAVTVPLVYGLYRLHRWAFVVFNALCLLSVIYIFKIPDTVLVNFIFGGILLTAYPYFFLKEKGLNNGR